MRTRREIEEKVSELLSKHRITSPAVDVQRIAEFEGLPVIENMLNSDVSGALIRTGLRSAIAVNGKHHNNRKRFTIAHELAHHLLCHIAEGEDHIDWEFSILRRDRRSSEASDVQEIEANMFAANLLMPRSLLTADIHALMSTQGQVELSEDRISMLSQRYRVSSAAMKFRLINLGFMPPY